MSHPDADFVREYLKPLVGGRIVAVGANEDDGAWPTISVMAEDGSRTFDLEIGADEEGNGPGFVFGLPLPERGAA